MTDIVQAIASLPTPETDAIWVDPNKVGVNGTILALDTLARSLEQRLAMAVELLSEVYEDGFNEVRKSLDEKIVAFLAHVKGNVE